MESVEDVYQRLGELNYEDLKEHLRHEVKELFCQHSGTARDLEPNWRRECLVFNFLRNEEAKTQIIDNS